MKFIPAFLFLGFFSLLAYFVWTDQIPYYLLPEDPADPNRLERAQRFVTQGHRHDHLAVFRDGPQRALSFCASAL